MNTRDNKNVFLSFKSHV